MKLHQLLLIAALALSIPAPAFAQGDLAQCRRIDDVSVPYDVAIDGASVTFSTGGDQIVVRPAEIVAAGRTFSGPQAATYYNDVRRFLQNARTMAKAALPFSGDSATMSSAATNMCMAIIAVAASGSAVEQAFPGFRSPVRVKFK